MFSEDVGNVLKQVIASWQVIFITLAFILFVFIVNYISRDYHRPRAKKPSMKKKKAAPAPAAETSSTDSGDGLVLEED
ncbi:MAG: hypothetical protein LBQ93_04785 [Treponema sp.]|jgi:flagellar biosynthesis/type III secretory pathway M-ring protein FliF/YscJ|nr:hypothetical protein [Treponema sp.]